MRKKKRKVHANYNCQKKSLMSQKHFFRRVFVTKRIQIEEFNILCGGMSLPHIHSVLISVLGPDRDRPMTLCLSFAYNLSFIERGTYWEVVWLLMASLMQTSQMCVYTFFMLYLCAVALLTKIRRDRDHLGISRVEIYFSRSLLKII